MRPPARRHGASFRVLDEVKGEISITDANVDARRRVVSSDMVFVAEGLDIRPGTSYRLIAAGKYPVNIKHLPS